MMAYSYENNDKFDSYLLKFIVKRVLEKTDEN